MNSENPPYDNSNEGDATFGNITGDVLKFDPETANPNIHPLLEKRIIATRGEITKVIRATEFKSDENNFEVGEVVVDEAFGEQPTPVKIESVIEVHTDQSGEESVLIVNFADPESGHLTHSIDTVQSDFYLRKLRKL